MIKVQWILALLCLTGLTLAKDAGIMLHDALLRDLQNGVINRAEYVAYQLMGIRNSPELPPNYRAFNHRPTRMGTGLMLEASALLEQTSGREQQLLQSVLYRPDYLPLSKTSPSGLFKLHYTDIGANAAADTFITLAAEAFDYSYDLIVNQLHFSPPPKDDIDGPEYDVYVYNLGDYGMTTPDGSASTLEHPNGAVSYIHMDNTFTRTYTKGESGMLVTTAHEFLHMVQIGYRNFTTSEFDSRWLFEGCAVWMEDYAFDDINDYLQYLPSYFADMSRSFYTYNGLHEYGTGVFYMMLEQKYGPEVMRQIWEHFAREEVFDAVDNALRQYGSSFALELSEHMIWNYFTGQRANPQLYYAEGEKYPLVTTTAIDSVSSNFYISDNLNHMGAHFVEIKPQNFGELTIQPEIDSPAHWMYAVIQDAEYEAPLVSLSTGARSVLLPDVTPANSVHIVPVHVYLPKTNEHDAVEAYSFTVTLGDAGSVTAGIQSIAPNPFQPGIHSQGAQVSVRLTEKTDRLAFYVADENGRIVYSQKMGFESPQKGDFVMHWAGTTNEGRLVPSGIYLFYFDTAQPIRPGKIAVIR